MYRCHKTGVYYASIKDESGKRIRRSTGSKDRETAEDIAAQWRVSKTLERAPEPTYDEIMAHYLSTVSAGSRSHQTNVSVANVLDPILTGTRVLDIDVEELVDRLLEERSPASVRRYLSVLASAIRHGPKQSRGKLAELRTHQPLADSGLRIRWEEKAVIHRIAAQAESIVSDAIMLAAYTGMRQGEVLGLTWDRVDLSRRLIHLTPDTQKNRRYATIPLNESAYRAVLNRKRVQAGECPGAAYVFSDARGERLSRHWLTPRFNAAVSSCGVSDFTFHDLRHCFCSWLLQSGVELARVKDAARHQDLRTTLRYAHLHTDALRDTVLVLDGREVG